MPLSATSHANLHRFQTEHPAEMQKLLDGVKSGDISPSDAAAEIPGVTPLDIMDVAANGLEDIASNADARAMGRAGADAPSTFGGLAAGGTLASKGAIFNQTWETTEAASGALAGATRRDPVSFKERVGEMLPEFQGGGAKSALKSLGIAAAAAGGAFFMNPLLSPMAFVISFYMGMKAQALPGEKTSKKDPISAEEGAALKAAFDGASPEEKGAMGAAFANFKFEGIEIDPSAQKVVDEVSAYAQRPEGVAAQRYLDAAAAVRGVLTGEGETAALTAVLESMTPDQLEEVRPFLWDGLHDKKGNPDYHLKADEKLTGMIFSDRAAGDLATYMVAAFAAAGSHGGDQVTKKEVKLLLAQLERFEPSIAHPALEAAGSQLAQMNIAPDAADTLAAVLEGIAAGATQE